MDRDKNYQLNPHNKSGMRLVDRDVSDVTVNAAWLAQDEGCLVDVWLSGTYLYTVDKSGRKTRQ